MEGHRTDDLCLPEDRDRPKFEGIKCFRPPSYGVMQLRPSVRLSVTFQYCIEMA